MRDVGDVLRASILRYGDASDAGRELNGLERVSEFVEDEEFIANTEQNLLLVDRRGDGFGLESREMIDGKVFVRREIGDRLLGSTGRRGDLARRRR